MAKEDIRWWAVTRPDGTTFNYPNTRDYMEQVFIYGGFSFKPAHPLVGLVYEHHAGGRVTVIDVSPESGRALVRLPDGRDHGVDVKYLEDIAKRQANG